MAAPKHNFTKEQVAEYRDHFNMYDEDKSGTVEAGELKSVLAKCGVEMSDTQVADMIKDVDKDGSGNLDFDEFLAMMAKVQGGPSEREIRGEMFSMMDDNLDGYVTVDELRAFFRKAAVDTKGAVEVPSDETLKQMIAETAGDGVQLSPEDLDKLIEQIAAA